MLNFCVLCLLFACAANVFGQNVPDNSARAEAFIRAVVEKDFAAAENYFDDNLKAKLPADKLAETWGSVVAQVGEFKTSGKISKTKQENFEVIVTTCEFEKASLDITTAFDAQGKIGGLFFAPSKSVAAAYETPAYANPALFEEKDLTIGSGEWTLPATLTMPKGKTRVPAIVLIHGSGPNDRDETINGNKVFKDLAWGLASKGIAVLRYEKRTRQYGAKLAAVKNFTVNEETVDDALAAVQTLRQTAGIDATKIFALGHSLGGMMIPRIGQRDGEIAGLIVFAGTARPLEDVVAEQIAYLSSFGEASPETQRRIEEFKKMAEKTKNLKAGDAADTPTLLNLPVSYWLDLNGYNPSQTAATLKQPMLILQGESDYQVTMKDFQIWKTALAGRKNVAFKTYPKLTHLFMETGGERPSPHDYEKTSHVSAQVVADIADWILKTAV